MKIEDNNKMKKRIVLASLFLVGLMNFNVVKSTELESENKLNLKTETETETVRRHRRPCNRWQWRRCRKYCARKGLRVKSCYVYHGRVRCICRRRRN